MYLLLSEEVALESNGILWVAYKLCLYLYALKFFAVDVG
jgi:hypothetical protein